MTIHRLQIRRSTLRAILKFAPSADIRYYLNGVLIEVSESRLFAVATTGTVLAAIREDDCEGCAPAQFIIPHHMLAKLKASKLNPLVAVTYDDESHAITIDDTINGQTFTGRAIDGKFPDWRRVMPTSATGEAADFNPELLAVFSDAAHELDGTRTGKGLTYVHQNGPSAALVQLLSHSCFRGVIMARAEPKTGRAVFPNVSEWVNADAAVAA